MANLDKSYFEGNMDKERPIQSFLNMDERILWKGKPKKSAYILGKTMTMMPIGLLWGIIDFSMLFAIFRFGQIPITALFFIVPFFAIHLTPFWIWLRGLIKSASEARTIEYLITDQRIIVFVGSPRRILDSINLGDMVDAQLKIGLIDKMLGVGDITIVGEMGKLVMMTDIANSTFMHSKILGLCGKPELKRDEFFENKVECPYCGTIYSSEEKKCPSCGCTPKKN